MMNAAAKSTALPPQPLSTRGSVLRPVMPLKRVTGIVVSLLVVIIACLTPQVQAIFAIVLAHGEHHLNAGRMGSSTSVLLLSAEVYIGFLLSGVLTFSAFNLTLFGSLFPEADAEPPAGAFDAVDDPPRVG